MWPLNQYKKAVKNRDRFEREKREQAESESADVLRPKIPAQTVDAFMQGRVTTRADAKEKEVALEEKTGQTKKERGQEESAEEKKKTTAGKKSGTAKKNTKSK